jgi:hypothetical protein
VYSFRLVILLSCTASSISSQQYLLYIPLRRRRLRGPTSRFYAKVTLTEFCTSWYNELAVLIVLWEKQLGRKSDLDNSDQTC